MEKEKKKVLVNDKILEFAMNYVEKHKYPNKIKDIEVNVHPIFSRDIL